MLTAPAEKWVVMITTVTADNSCWLSSTGGAKIRSWIQDTIPDVIIIPQSGISETTILRTKRSFWRHTCFISTWCFFSDSSSRKKDVLMFRPQRAIILLLLQDVMWLNINVETLHCFQNAATVIQNQQQCLSLCMSEEEFEEFLANIWFLTDKTQSGRCVALHNSWRLNPADLKQKQTDNNTDLRFGLKAQGGLWA